MVIFLVIFLRLEATVTSLTLLRHFYDSLPSLWPTEKPQSRFSQFCWFSVWVDPIFSERKQLTQFSPFPADRVQFPMFICQVDPEFFTRTLELTQMLFQTDATDAAARTVLLSRCPADCRTEIETTLFLIPFTSVQGYIIHLCFIYLICFTHDRLILCAHILVKVSLSLSLQTYFLPFPLCSGAKAWPHFFYYALKLRLTFFY